MIKSITITFVLFSILISCKDPHKPLYYTNPIAIPPMRNPMIVWDDSIYYMIGTELLDGSITEDGPGIWLYKSHNLVNWTVVNQILKGEKWYRYRILAPEIKKINNKYYLTVNHFSGNPVSQSVSIFESNRIVGPYIPLISDSAFCMGNDSHLFQDVNGDIYLFTSDNGGKPLHEVIMCREITLDPLTMIGKPFVVITPGTKDDWDGSVDQGVAIDGPNVIKKGNIYYLIYSSWGRGYEVGYATANNIKGPWTKSERNPIYGAQSIEFCKRHGKFYTQSTQVPFTEVGHGNFFTTSNGELWLSSHAIKGNSIPQLAIDPVIFDSFNNMNVKLTWTPQEVPLE